MVTCAGMVGKFLCFICESTLCASPGHLHYSADLPVVLGVITSIFQKLNNTVLPWKHVMCFGEIWKLALSMKQRLSKGQTAIHWGFFFTRIFRSFKFLFAPKCDIHKVIDWTWTEVSRCPNKIKGQYWGWKRYIGYKCDCWGWLNARTQAGHLITRAGCFEYTPVARTYIMLYNRNRLQ